MNEILTALYDSFYTPPQAADTHAKINAIHQQLIQKLDKPERRLVLRLIDAKDHLAEETSIDSFICGFRLAWRLANELNSYPENGVPPGQIRPSRTPVVRHRSNESSPSMAEIPPVPGTG